MKAARFLAILVTLLGMFELQAQHTHAGFCGTSREALDVIQSQVLTYLAEIGENEVDLRNGAITYVPVRFHIVRKSDGTGGIEIDKILSMLCGINEFYADQEISFFIKDGFNYINNNTLFDNPQHNSSITLMNNSRIKGALNIFITNQTGEVGTLAYYTPGNPLWSSDYIVIRKDQIIYNKGTIEHELAHFFSVLHTFNGWECEPFDKDIHGIPLTNPTAPCFSLKSPWGNVLAELADGSNSTVAGDFLDDTPADYNLGLGWNTCTYTGGARDFNNQLLDPDELNLMGYFLTCKPLSLSNKQKLLIKSDLNSRKIAGSTNNRYLNTNVTPILGETGPVTAITPPNEGLSNGTMNIKLQWNPGPAATSYVVRIDRFQSFGFQPKYYYVTQPEVTLDFTLGNSGKYYWQVYAYNAFNTCPIWGDIFNFTVGPVSSITEVKGLSNIHIAPQPSLAGQNITVYFEADQALDLQMYITDINGRLLHSVQKLIFPSGQHQYILPWVPQTPGMYFMRWQSENGISTLRFVVQ